MTPYGRTLPIFMPMVFLICWTLRKSQAVQAWALKEGRSAGEISHYLLLLQFLSGILGFALIVSLLFQFFK